MLLVFIIFVSFVVTGIYLLLISIFTKGWTDMPHFEPQSVASRKINIRASLIVPCHNEEKTLPTLLKYLTEQTNKHFELILVNDHSTDGTEQIMSDFIKDFPNATYLNTEGKGKKNALKEAIRQSSEALIITTDADCTPDKEWIDTILRFQSVYPSDLLICPVNLKVGKSLFEQIQRFEFLSLIISGAGAAGIQNPILCNAANLAFRKEVWEKAGTDLHFNHVSGDDIFLLESVKKQKGTIRFLKSEKAMVYTKSANSFSEFFNQRSRWASKSPFYRDKMLIFTACIIFAVSLIQLALLGLSLFNVQYLIPFIVIFLLKYWVDARILSKAKSFFQLKNVPLYAFLLSLTYPFYIVFTASASFFRSKKTW